MIFETKSYHHYFREGRFEDFSISLDGCAFWIGIDPPSFKPEMKEQAEERLRAALEELENYITDEPFFKKSLKPCEVKETAPEIIKRAAGAAFLGNTGPMAAVPAVFCETIGQMLLDNFRIEELVVEDGNNLYLKLQESLNVCIFAGESPLSEMAGIEIKAEQTPVAVCSSSGTAGSLLNYGKADAVLIASANAALAGALATGFNNLVKKPADVGKVLARAKAIPEVTGALAVFEDQVGLHGSFELNMLD